MKPAIYGLVALFLPACAAAAHSQDFNTPAPGFITPAPGFTEPAPGFTEPAPGFTEPAPGFTEPVPEFQSPPDTAVPEDPDGEDPDEENPDDEVDFGSGPTEQEIEQVLEFAADYFFQLNALETEEFLFAFWETSANLGLEPADIDLRTGAAIVIYLWVDRELGLVREFRDP